MRRVYIPLKHYVPIYVAFSSAHGLTQYLYVHVLQLSRPKPNIPLLLSSSSTCNYIRFFPHDTKAAHGPGRPHYEASHSNLDTPHSVGLLWTSDQPNAGTCT
jgi:hypothetical protein